MSHDGVIQDSGRGMVQNSRTLRWSEVSAGNHGFFELTVIKPPSDHPTRGWPVTDLHIPGRHTKHPARRRMHGKLCLAFGSGIASGIVHERSLADPRFARGRVKTRGYQIPVTCQ